MATKGREDKLDYKSLAPQTDDRQPQSTYARFAPGRRRSLHQGTNLRPRPRGTNLSPSPPVKGLPGPPGPSSKESWGGAIGESPLCIANNTGVAVRTRGFHLKNQSAARSTPVLFPKLLTVAHMNGNGANRPYTPHGYMGQNGAILEAISAVRDGTLPILPFSKFNKNISRKQSPPTASATTKTLVFALQSPSALSRTGRKIVLSLLGGYELFLPPYKVTIFWPPPPGGRLALAWTGILYQGWGPPPAPAPLSPLGA